MRSGEARADADIVRIIDFCLRLETFPRRGTQRDDVLPGLRTVGFERRITIAFTVTVTAAAVVIEGIFYGGQDLSSWRPGS